MQASESEAVVKALRSVHGTSIVFITCAQLNSVSELNLTFLMIMKTHCVHARDRGHPIHCMMTYISADL